MRDEVAGLRGVFLLICFRFNLQFSFPTSTTTGVFFYIPYPLYLNSRIFSRCCTKFCIIIISANRASCSKTLKRKNLYDPCQRESQKKIAILLVSSIKKYIFCLYMVYKNQCVLLKKRIEDKTMQFRDKRYIDGGRAAVEGLKLQEKKITLLGIVRAVISS